MKAIFRKGAFFLAAGCMAFVLSAAVPALADEPGPGGTGCKPCVETSKTSAKKKVYHAKSYKKAKKGKALSGNSLVRAAQEHLKHLGYYTGKVDGKMGPQTKSAIKNFQRDHGLKADGILGPQTMRALEEADNVVSSKGGRKGAFLTHEYVDTRAADGDIDQDYQPPLRGGVKALYSRFTGLNISQTGDDATGKRYAVVLNGQPILTAGGQSSVIEVSKTFEVGDVDAVILTTYSPDSTVCPYSTYVVVLSSTDSKLLEVENCTRIYDADVSKGSLIISFPERAVNRALGATWRLEGFNLTRL